MAVLEARGIRKSYGGVEALKGCDLAIEAGSVHALLGENGAGKSTLVKVLTGSVHQDAGEVLLDGELVRFADINRAATQGVAVVSQELNLFPDLDVVGNLFIGRAPRRFGVFDRREMIRRALPVLADLGLDISPGTQLGELSLAEQQLVEVARALLTKPRVLILDEPTSALDDAVSSRLLDVLRVLRDRQVGVVFVSHILEEVMVLCDVVTILRDGEVVTAAEPIAAMTIPAIVRAMVGDSHDMTIAPIERVPSGRDGAAVDDELVITDVTSAPRLNGVSLTAHHGEIVGLAGVVGAGHRRLLEVIAGRHRVDRGTLRLPQGSTRRPPRGLRRAVSTGVALVSGDRKRGLLFDGPIWLNMAQVNSVALGRDGLFVRRLALRNRARTRVAELNIKTAGVEQAVAMLSGGNQQKVVLAKWMEASPSVLLLDDPTRGVAVGSKADIHRLLRRACDDAVVLLCSTDLDELVTLCDRVLVFRHGRIAAELTGAELNRNRLLNEMNGGEAAIAS